MLNEQRLREAVKTLQQGSFYATDDGEKSIIALIELAELVLSVQGVFPEKKQCFAEHERATCGITKEMCMRCNINQSIDACILAISKKLMGLERLLEDKFGLVEGVTIELGEKIGEETREVWFDDLAQAIRSELLGKGEK